MHSSLLVAVVLTVLVLSAALAAYFVPRLRHTPAPVTPLARDADEVADSLASSDAVMRALKLVQQQYAALVRRYDAAETELRQLKEENHELRAQNQELHSRYSRP